MKKNILRSAVSFSALMSLSASLSLITFGCQSSQMPEPVSPEPEKSDQELPVDPRYTELPRPTSTPLWTPPSATKTELNNGLSIWHMKHGSAPLVSIHVVLPSGSSADPEGKAGLTMLAADLLDEGAGKLSALELSDELGQLATDYGSQAGVDFVLLSMSALAENLDASLQLLSEIVLRPQLKKDEFERRKKHYEASALAAQDDPRAAQQRALSHALFGDGYASRPSSGTVESLSGITWNDAKKRAKELTVPEGAHLVIAGVVDEAVATASIEKYFGKWTGKRNVATVKLEEPQTPGKLYVVDFPDAAQSSLSVAMRAGKNGDPNYFAEEVMQQKLGGSFTGRINMNLREDKGYTYGARSSFQRLEHSGYFSVSADVKSETTKASITEIFKELSDVCGPRPLTEDERNEAVEGMLLGYPLDFDQVESAGYRLASLPLRDRPTDYWTTWPVEIKAITTERANEAAKPYCDPSKYDIVLAGDKKRLDADLKSLGREIVELDRDGHPVSDKPGAED